MKVLAVKTSGAFGDQNKGDLECAMVNAEELLKALAPRVSIIEVAQAADDQLNEITFWGCFAKYFNFGLVSRLQDKYTDFDSSFYDHGFFVLPETDDQEAFLSSFDESRAECHLMTVRRTAYSNGNPLVEVVLSAMPKHFDATVYTDALTLRDLKDVVCRQVMALWCDEVSLEIERRGE